MSEDQENYTTILLNDPSSRSNEQSKCNWFKYCLYLYFLTYYILIFPGLLNANENIITIVFLFISHFIAMCVNNPKYNIQMFGLLLVEIAYMISLEICNAIGYVNMALVITYTLYLMIILCMSYYTKKQLSDNNIEVSY